MTLISKFSVLRPDTQFEVSQEDHERVLMKLSLSFQAKTDSKNLQPQFEELVKEGRKQMGGDFSVQCLTEGDKVAATFTRAFPVVESKPPVIHGLSSKGNILIATACNVEASLVSRPIEKLSLSPVRAFRGDQALHLAQESEMEIAFISLNLPHIDGIELAQRLAETRHRPRLFGILPFTSVPTYLEERLEVFDKFFLIPFSLDQIARSVVDDSIYPAPPISGVVSENFC